MSASKVGRGRDGGAVGPGDKFWPVRACQESLSESVDEVRKVGNLMRMAQRVITQLVDDIDGKEIVNGKGETVLFALDGTTYEIDLSDKNAEKFRGLFQEYIAAGRKAGRSSGRTRRAPGASGNAAEIREWAKSNGLDVPDRGRIPASVRNAFEAR